MSLDKSWSGMNLREYAAIHLGVPDSGDAELDAMIRKANRRDFAKAAMGALIQCGQSFQVHTEDGVLTVPARIGVPKLSKEYADALLSALEAKP